MEEALSLHRLHFAFTITFHYLFPQLTMGLALLIVILKTRALQTGDRVYDESARFWGKIFGINFAMGVVTGIPMEFQFGTNWARFSEAAGGVIGQTLAMEGVLAFFLESSFLGLFLFGEKRLGPKLHWLTAVLVFFGSWLSGLFIVATNSFMQHPVGYRIADDGSIILSSFWKLLTNPWLGPQYAHTMTGAVVTGSFAMAALGSFYLLSGRHTEHARVFLRLGVLVGLPASLIVAMPTGDLQAKMVVKHKPEAFASMEGLFESREGAPLVLIGQPDMENRRLDNAIELPQILSFLTFMDRTAHIRGLNEFPEEDWPDLVPLHYYSYHIMVGLGTFFIAAMAAAAWLLWRGKLFETRPVLWVLMLLAPFPYIANTTGWMTAELGRQPWLIRGLMRTSEGFSHTVVAGNALFSLMGFMGIYMILGLLFLFLVGREIAHGPEALSDQQSDPISSQIEARA
jgi:cytochrome d ubiquinol oxidase subunit I